MRAFRNQVDVTRLGPTESHKPDARRKGRVKAEMLESSLGQAVDLSETGIRLERRGSFKLTVGSTLLVALKGPQRSLTCPARVAWVRKVGWFKSQMGLQFLDDSETFRRSLRELSMSCMDMRTLSADSEELSREAS